MEYALISGELIVSAYKNLPSGVIPIQDGNLPAAEAEPAIGVSVPLSRLTEKADMPSP
jgi:hypothetical protein